MPQNLQIMLNTVLQKLNIAALNNMQIAAIAAIEKKRDVLLLSPTGSGKTLAFLLPLLDFISLKTKGVQVLILVPSRELGLQIEQVFKQMDTGFKVNCCYGGHPVKTEKNNLIQPPAVLIGTPGRIAYHVRNESFDVQTVKVLVLDEFDKSLEFGFETDMTFIIQSLRNLQKNVLTSATKMEILPPFTGIKNIFEVNFLKDIEQKPALKLKTVLADGQDKLATLFNLICKTENKTSLVFCNHRDAVERISELLYDREIAHGIFHGGMDQPDREKSLIKFRNGSYHILVTTDLASRGLDIPETAFVIHYQLPNSLDAYTHRNGRTARMKADGTAYLILGGNETLPKFIIEEPEIEKLSENLPLPKPTDWVTFYVAAGKKDKVNKVDIVGLLLQKGKLEKAELGLIEVADHVSYAAVNRKKLPELLRLLKDEKIKGKKFRMGLDG